MPSYNIMVENRKYKVEIRKEQAKGSFTVKVNDRPVQVALKASETNTGEPLIFKVQDKTYVAEVGQIDRNTPFTVKVNDIPFKVTLTEPERQMRTSGIQPPRVHTRAQQVTKLEESQATATGKGNVTAPMAGKIVSVKVKEGDLVKVGDVVCILEAMKMENEITAPKNGEIQKVNVTEGTAVSEKDVLIVIK